MMGLTNFLTSISKVIDKDRIYTDDLRRLAWGTDAGFYRLVPQVVLRSKSEDEVASILKAASLHNVPVTFRAAGTSLSGQAVSDSVLVVAGKHWESISTDDGGLTVTLQPGVVGSKVNDFLRPYGRKFGPDPASIKSCMVGGIVMNNASGMSCGTGANSDRMLLSGRIVFADGTVLDTADQKSRQAFRHSHPEIISKIESLRDEVLNDSELTDRIRHKYSIKNVTGLNILPLILYEDPFDIILHLLVGSEGTLAFLSQVKMTTLKQAPLQANAMVYFKDMAEAARAVIAMRKVNVSAAEMLDKRSLASVNAGDIEGLTAVLTMVEAESQHELADKVKAVTDTLKDFDTYSKVEFTTDPEEYGRYWAIRSGIFPTVGGMRKPGTTCLIEDVAFHVDDLAEAVTDLSDLLDRHGYDDSCIYGHALEGNFHFIINQSFDSEKEIQRYKDMITEVGELVVKKYDGSLKAEHGTGRNMAPYVEYEWGEKAFNVMKRIKEIFDPQNILNPGVIFNDDPECCFKNFKALPLLKPADGAPEETVAAYAKINKCIECGFCEVNCVSCGFTMSSRTRIVLQREMEHLRQTGENPELLERLRKQYSYPGEQTCAGDGLCSMSCPMGINVGDLTHEVRRQNMGKTANAAGKFAADKFHGVKTALRGVLHLADFGHGILGDKAMGTFAKVIHAAGLPLWTPAMPKAYNAAKKLKPAPDSSHDKVVYFPSCLNQTMGIDKASKGMKPLAEEMTSLLRKSGYEVIFPKNMDSLCCGTIWESKGLPEIALNKTRELEDALWEASEHGKYPVVCDQSPCLHRMKQHMTKVHLYESAEFIWKSLKDRLTFTQTDIPVALHLTCSTKLMKIDRIVHDLACLCSSAVLVPEGVGCCGFAGDKGMTHPELNAYALRKLRSQIRERGIEVGYSNSRTCEIGLQTNSGIPYRSIVYLVNACTTSRSLMKRMIICESGATKADWRVVENGEQTARELSAGMNVSTMKMDAIESIVRDAAERLPSGKYDEIHFYTAGVITSSIQTEMERILGTCFEVGEVELQTDLVASARAACGHEPGIAAIMGTGSNSCQWDGKKIVRQVKSGGFIIGDDGSASVLGKIFISDFIKGLVPEEIAEEYAEKYPHEYQDIVEMVYHNPGSPSGWLGSLCPFILSHYSHPYIKQLVDNNFRAFVERSLRQYETDKYPVGIIGGFGNALKEIVGPIFEENGIRIREFIPSPIEELIKYHM